jgi:hypothetical protein
MVFLGDIFMQNDQPFQPGILIDKNGLIHDENSHQTALLLAIHYGNGANRTKANHNYMLAEKTGIFIV